MSNILFRVRLKPRGTPSVDLVGPIAAAVLPRIGELWMQEETAYRVEEVIHESDRVPFIIAKQL